MKVNVLLIFLFYEGVLETYMMNFFQALASSVSRDISGPHYKYHDDPFLTPASNIVKRTFSLSKEAGRKAARWIRDENAQFFTHRPEDPFIDVSDVYFTCGVSLKSC